MTIASWLDNPADYPQGVKLYEEYGNNSALKKLFASGATSFTKSKLIQELTNIAASMKTAPSIIQDEEFVSLEKKAKKLYGEMSYLRSQIKHMQSKQEREIACLKIVNTFTNELHPAFEKLDYFREHGAFPAVVVEVEETDPVKLIAKRNTLRTYISKANSGKMNKEKLSLWEAELKEIERKLGE